VGDVGSASPVLETFLRLSLIEGFTAEHLRRLRGGGIATRLPGAEPPAVRSLRSRAESVLSSPEAGRKAEEIRERCAGNGIAILPFADPGYPAALRRIPYPPLILYRSGGPFPEDPAVAVVGSRAPTAAGKEFARDLSRELAAAGWTVVSGMARGIDAAAHEGAAAAGGVTVAVLGCGVDVVYPPEHGELREKILLRGAVLSEYPPGTLPLPRRFPARNRIVSGLCRGVVVAEAPERSGALITAGTALEQGREVLVVPGNPWFAHTAGSNRLLRDGATPVCSAEDVSGALGVEPLPVRSTLARGVLCALTGERTAAELSGALGAPLGDVVACLGELEVAKWVEMRAGGYYKRKTERPGPIPGVSTEGEWRGR
jgi:DNA processing protein